MKIMTKIGSGSFANVFLAERNKNQVAIKIANNNLPKEDAIRYAKYEVDILRRFQTSKYILNLLDYKIDNFTNLIITELLGDGLHKLIKYYRNNGQYIPIDIVKKLSKQILRGLTELKNKNVLHNDIKAENILLYEKLPKIFKQSPAKFSSELCKFMIGDYNDLKSHAYKFSEVIKHIYLRGVNVKIVDFGNAYSLAMKTDRDRSFGTSRPTRPYISPEILIRAPHWVESDIWSFGCIVYELITTKILFSPYRENNMGINSMHLAAIINVFGCKFTKKFLKRGKKSDRYFIGQRHKFNYLIKKNRKFADLFLFNNTPMREIHGILDFLGPIFKIDPNDRITAEKCLDSVWLL